MILYQPLVVLADTKLVSLNTSQLSSNIDQRLSTIQTLRSFTESGDNLNNHSTSKVLWEYQSLVTDLYLYSLSNNTMSDEYTKQIEKLFEAELVISKSARDMNLADDSSLKSFQSSLYLIKDAISGEIPDSEIKEAYMADLTDPVKVREALKDKLSNTVPSMIDSFLSANKDTPVTADTKEDFLLIRGAIEDLQGFNEKYNNGTDTLDETDKLDTSKVGKLLSDHSGILDKVKDLDTQQIQTGSPRVDAPIEAYENAQRFCAFVKKLTYEEVKTLLKMPLLSQEAYDVLTGEHMWASIEGTGIETINETQKKTDEVARELNIRLTAHYIAMFSATSVYSPLLSKVGDTDYLEAMYYLIDPSQKEIIKETYAMLQTYKKPLYYMRNFKDKSARTALGYSYADVGGEAQRLTIGSVMDAIDQSKPIVALTMKGKMVKDADSWIYYNHTIGGQDEEARLIESKLEDSSTMSDSGSNYSHVIFEMNYNWQKSDTGTITGLVMKNIFESETLKYRWEALRGQTLYVDVFGNIIIQDGTVVLPAAANPTYFTKSVSTLGYNPFTVAVYNNYPQFYGNITPTVVEKNADAKYMFISTNYLEDGALANLADAKINDLNDAVKYIFSAVTNLALLSNPVFPVKYEATDKSVNYEMFNNTLLYPIFFLQSGDGSSSNTLMEFPLQTLKGPISLGGKENILTSMANYFPIRFNTIITSDGKQIFPYLSANTSADSAVSQSESYKPSYESAKVIAFNMFNYISNPSDGENKNIIGNGNIRESYLFKNVILSVLDGITTPTAYEKSVTNENILNLDTMGVIGSTIAKGIDSYINFMHNVRDYIGVTTPDSNSMFSTVYNVVTAYPYVILFIYLMILFSIYLRSRSTLKLLLSALTIGSSFFLMLFIVPKIMPYFVGTITYQLSDSISTNVLVGRGEQYEHVNEKDSILDGDRFDLGSLKLYELGYQEAFAVRKRLNLDETDITTIYPLQDTMGVYLSGTEVRLDLKTYFQIDTYYSEFNEEGMYYELKSGEHIISPEIYNYYMPLLYLEKGFVSNLNLFWKHYKTAKGIIKYPDGLYKDGSLVSSFIKSYPFLQVLPDVEKRMALEISATEEAMIKEEFPNKGDVMDLAWLVDREFEDLDYEIQDTIWIQTMFRNGYYHPISGRERRQELVDYVNSEVYSMLVRLTPEIGLVSDENIIRTVAIYSTIVFNDKISRFNDVVYPRYLPVNEFSVRDILTATVLSKSNRYMYYDVKLASNILVEKGIIGTIATAGILSLMALTSLINTILFSFVYFAGFLATTLLVFMDKSIRGVVSFVAKALTIIVVNNILNIMTLNIYPHLSYKFNIYILLILQLALLVVTIKLILWLAKGTDWAIDKGSVVNPIAARLSSSQNNFMPSNSISNQSITYSSEVNNQQEDEDYDSSRRW